MARDKLTVHKKGYKRRGYYREPYERKDGTKVAGAWVGPSEVSSSTFKIQDRGLPGRGKKLIRLTKGGMVSPAGEYHVTSPAAQRHKVLKSLITKEMRTRDKTRDEAELSVYRRLLAMRTLFKNTEPKYARTINADMDYFKKYLTGSNKKMAYPTEAVRKWKGMSHSARVKSRAK